MSRPRSPASDHRAPGSVPARHGGAPPTPGGPLRDVLRSFSPASDTHAGLWLDRFLPKHDKSEADGDKKGSIQGHIKALLTIAIPRSYLCHFDRWQAHVNQLEAAGKALKAEARVLGRMIVGLGAESVLETAIHLHHTYGVPVIPGSALKGLIANYARNRLNDEAWRKPEHPAARRSVVEAGPAEEGSEGASYRALFGDTAEAGCVIFHDALWIPSTTEPPGLPLDLDVMTVHHAKYYTDKHPPPPADSDAPNPVSFVTARGAYLIVLEGPPEWTAAAMSLLKWALEDEGIGAKTAAGYGRLDLKYDSDADRAEKARVRSDEDARTALESAAEDARKAAERSSDAMKIIDKSLSRLSYGNADNEVPHIIKHAEHVGKEERRKIAERCIVQLGRDFQKGKKRNKRWAIELENFRGEIA